VLNHDVKRLAGCVTLWLLLAACSNEVAGSPIGTGQIVDSNPSVTAPPGTSGPRPTPTVPNWPKAADGQDLTACYDGTCEVELRAPVSIPMDPALGVAEWRLESVDDAEGAYLTAKTTDGAGTFSANVSAPPGFGPVTVVLNGWQISGVATANGVAVLGFSPP
jgi:hypothetical protein